MEVFFVVICLLLVLVSIYPYYLIVRFLQLGCKVFKKYLKENNVHYLYTDDEE